MNQGPGIIGEIQQRFGAETVAPQATVDGLPTAWVAAVRCREVLRWLKDEAAKPYRMLYDLSAIDERERTKRAGQPASDFTVFYQLYSLERNEYLRLKVALVGEYPAVATITDLWAAADWYEREMWDMFGIRVEGHPNLRRLLMPDWWQGHPLRKDHPARATEMEAFKLSPRKVEEQQEVLQFKPEEWGQVRQTADREFMFLNLGPHHLGTHGLLRLALQLDDEEIVEAVADIGYHHRGAEKMGERQSWHSYIPYTDRIDYLGGVMNNLPYVLAVEKLAGIEAPDRAKVIRVMLCELFRIASHLVWYGTFASDLGAMSPVLFTFNDRERMLGIIEAVTGGRMHPSWFRIGGVSQDLPKGWDRLVREFLDYLPPKMDEYDTLVMGNDILKARTIGVGGLSTAEAIAWGVTGPNLRATGLDWDFRKKQPYSGYEQFEFDIPTAQSGDCYARAQVRVAEIRQSLRIVEQCLKNMPAGPYKADHPLATPPRKEQTMHDVATLVNHFLGVSWGPVIPAGEAFVGIEATKGNNGYYLISDGSTVSYRTRIRTPSFPHIQLLPRLSRGLLVSDLIAILGALDFVLGDVDR